MQIRDKVYLKPINNAARNENKGIREYEIKKIGKKYFEVWDGSNDYTINKFYIEGLIEVTKYSPDWRIYFSKQEILDEYEFENIARNIREVFGSYGKINLTLEQLRKIKEIIDIKD